MLRNGVKALRSIPPTLLKSSRPIGADPKFVCFSCQIRSLNVKSLIHRAVPGLKRPSSPALKDAVSAFQKHVESLEQEAKDILQRDEVEKEVPLLEITDSTIDQAYEALMAPEPDHVALPEPQQLVKQLPSPLVESLGMDTIRVENGETDWLLIISKLQEDKGFTEVQTEDMDKFIELVPARVRREKLADLEALARNSGKQWSVKTYELFMTDYLAARELSKVKDLFHEMVNNKNLPATTESYHCLLRAHALDNDLKSATQVFRDMQEKGVQPNVKIYNAYLNLAVVRSEPEIAWEVFNLMKLRSLSTAPTRQTYTTMIHLCAEMKEATKAMDLFTDMTERRGLMPTPDAYNAVIHACASDRDYFTQAWKYATKMQQAGFPIGKRELNVLLVACGRTGELTRARLLIKHMLVCGDKSKTPNAMSYMSLFRAYANYRPDPKREFVTADTAFSEALQSDAVKLLPTMAGAQKFAPPRDLVEKQLTYEDIPLSQKVVLSKVDILPEARAVLTYLRLNHPEFVDTQLMNAYLDICMDQKNPTELQRAYTVEMRGFMDTVRDITVLAAGKEIKAPRILRNCFTFKTALQSAAISRKLVFGRRVMEDREQYKATIPPKNADGTVDVNIYHQMSEKQRRKIDSETELWILRLLAKCELLGEAKQRIAVLAPIYKWEWEDLQTVYTKAIQVEDEGTAAFVKQVTGKADVESRRLERHERRNRRWL